VGTDQQQLKHTCVLVDKEIQSWDDENLIMEQLYKQEMGGRRHSVTMIALVWYNRLPGSDKLSDRQ